MFFCFDSLSDLRKMVTYCRYASSCVECFLLGCLSSWGLLLVILSNFEACLLYVVSVWQHCWPICRPKLGQYVSWVSTLYCPSIKWYMADILVLAENRSSVGSEYRSSVSSVQVYVCQSSVSDSSNRWNVDWHSTQTQPTLGKLSADTCTYELCISQVSTDSLPMCQPSVDQVHSFAGYYLQYSQNDLRPYAFVFYESWLMCWEMQNC